MCKSDLWEMLTCMTDVLTDSLRENTNGKNLVDASSLLFFCTKFLREHQFNRREQNSKRIKKRKVRYLRRNLVSSISVTHPRIRKNNLRILSSARRTFDTRDQRSDSTNKYVFMLFTRTFQATYAPALISHLTLLQIARRIARWGWCKRNQVKSPRNCWDLTAPRVTEFAGWVSELRFLTCRFVLRIKQQKRLKWWNKKAWCVFSKRSWKLA